MKKIVNLLFYVIVIITLPLSTSCNNDDDSNSGCFEDTLCTLIFVTIDVSVVDNNQNPVALDSFQVINRADGSDFTLQLSNAEFELAQQNGRYPIANDNNVEANQQLELEFKGFINNEEVITSNYIVGADCCHVNLISGDIELVLE